MISLQLRNFLFIVLQPGVAVFLVPYLILRGFGYEICPSTLSIRHFIGGMLMLVGTFGALMVIFRFVAEGHGTISPLDPTKKLVVNGIYRYTRNPMYIAATMVVTGAAIVWWSIELLVYASLLFTAFFLFVVLHEEPRLRRVFGDEYTAYCSKVRRWL